MPTIQLQNFAGVNRRSALEVAPPRSLYIGRNVEVTLGRSLRARGALRKVCDLHPQSVGLYSVGGALRTVIPGGQGFPLEALGIVRVKYDQIGSPTIPFTTGTVTVTNGSTIVTLVGGVWPADIVGATFYVPSKGAQIPVASRVSDAQIRLTADWPAPSGSGLTFILNGYAPAYPLDVLIGVPSVEVMGFSRESGAYPYIVIKRWLDAANHDKGVRYEHHWITNAFNNGNQVAASHVPLPFSPGPALTKLSGRLWASDDTGSEIRFCSVQFGPRDWTTPDDAGFISVLDHALGDRSLNGLGVYNDRLAVIFADSVQLWQTAINPADISFLRALGGPGTEAVGSVVNVRGDLFYFTRGGFRSLQTETVTGQQNERDDIGAAVYDLTLDLDGALARAVWSQRLGCYLCAFGEQVFVYRNSPNAKVTEWTVWDFPGTPVDYILEFSGELYIRSGDAVYQLMQDADEGVSWEAQFHFAQGRERHTRRRWDWIEVVQSGTADIDFAQDPIHPDVHFPAAPQPPLRLSGSTTQLNRVFIGAISPLLAVRFRGTGPWQLDSLSLTYLQLPW